MKKQRSQTHDSELLEVQETYRNQKKIASVANKALCIILYFVLPVVFLFHFLQNENFPWMSSNRECNRTDSGTCFIKAYDRWTDTGLSLKKGESVQISTKGQWTANGRAEGLKTFGWVGAEGNTALTEWEQCTDGVCAPVMHLIGKVGNTTFAIGAKTSFTSPANGKLYLAPNDPCCLSDNSGELEVTLTPKKQ